MGNQLVAGAEIIASPGTAAEIAEFDPKLLADFKDNWQAFGELGVFYHNTMGRFNYDDVEVTPPNRIFNGELSLQIGDKRVELVDVGPAHTEGDTLVYVPDDKIVYTGDILFHLGHPIVWAGPISGWINACDYILGLDVETIVPGHGPLADKQAVRNLREYFVYLSSEARKRYDTGMDYEQAAMDIALDAFDGWTDAERIVVNIYNLYREFGADLPEAGAIEMFDAMARHKAAKDCCGEQHN
jgi:glyoxylase-like metal-dependent hydrolase (beta-lactamase superfamily II)